MVQHLPLVRLPIVWWGTTGKDCRLFATLSRQFMSILVTDAAIRSMALAKKRSDLLPPKARLTKRWLGKRKN